MSARLMSGSGPTSKLLLRKHTQNFIFFFIPTRDTKGHKRKTSDCDEARKGLDLQCNVRQQTKKKSSALSPLSVALVDCRNLQELDPFGGICVRVCV